MTEQDTFAYGGDWVRGIGCPATAAGYTPLDDDGSTVAANEYDALLTEPSDRSGVVDESTAREAWLKVVENLSESRHHDHTAAKDIAEKLGWDDML